MYPDRVLLTNEDAGLSCEPDLTFVAWDSLETRRVRLVERVTGDDYVELVGSPDLVVEIVSDSSVRKDTRLLRDAYARAGVREYWLIDARGENIAFQILVHRDGAFVGSGEPAAPQSSGVLGGRWQFTRVRGRMGLFVYTLSHTE